MKKIVLAVALMVMTVSTAWAMEPYTIDERGRCTAVVDHYVVVYMRSDVTLGVKARKGSWFVLDELEAYSYRFELDASSSMYAACVEKTTAYGPNSLTNAVKKLDRVIETLESDTRDAKQEAARHPDLAERIRRNGERTIENGADDFFDGLVRGAVDRALDRIFR